MKVRDAKIVTSSNPPEDTNVIWLNNGTINIFNDGKWTSVEGGSEVNSESSIEYIDVSNMADLDSKYNLIISSNTIKINNTIVPKVFFSNDDHEYIMANTVAVKVDTSEIYIIQDGVEYNLKDFFTESIPGYNDLPRLTKEEYYNV